MSTIKSFCGPVGVVVVGPNLVFACEHAARSFAQAVSLYKDNAPLPVTGYHRFPLTNGVTTEEPSNVFTVKEHVRGVAEDGIFYRTYRDFPAETLETVSKVNVGDEVLVESRAARTVSRARVSYVFANSGYVQLDYAPLDGDSGSFVRTLEGNFVGFISSRSSQDGLVKANIVVPESIPVTVPSAPVVPAPVVPAPVVTGPTGPTGPNLPVVTGPTDPTNNGGAEFQRGVRAGQKQVAIEAFQALNPLAAALPDLMTKLNRYILTN